MGTGKSTVARRIAVITGQRFVDADAVIVERAGMSIAQMFEIKGEAAFRALEKEVCRDLSELTDVVIATGGGMLVDPENLTTMQETGFVVCLDASPEAIRARLSASRDRPLAENWEALLEARREAYAAIPMHVNTDQKSPDEIAQEIIALWRSESA